MCHVSGRRGTFWPMTVLVLDPQNRPLRRRVAPARRLRPRASRWHPLSPTRSPSSEKKALLEDLAKYRWGLRERRRRMNKPVPRGGCVLQKWCEPPHKKYMSFPTENGCGCGRNGALVNARRRTPAVPAPQPRSPGRCWCRMLALKGASAKFWLGTMEPSTGYPRHIHQLGKWHSCGWC